MRPSPIFLVLLAACALLSAAAWLRSAEYDEQYTLFITGGVARPVWPTHAFAAGDVLRLQAGHADLASIAGDLRRTDVHPPLYFWGVALWRSLFGGGLFVARLFSGACGVLALATVAVIAKRSGVPAVMAMLLMLGSYGFVYTSAIARGFALAQLLTLLGVAMLLWAGQRRGLAFAAGMLLGAATFSNYLTVFVAVATLLWLGLQQSWGDRPTRLLRLRLALTRGVWPFACMGFAAWLPADLWFFLAQRHSRSNQFPPFELLPSIGRLGQYIAANIFGGLPLYFDGAIRLALALALGGLLIALAALVTWRWRGNATRRLLALAALAPPLGLLLLGAISNNTPIELRYLAVSVPFISLLLAGCFATLPRWWRNAAYGVVLTIQAASVGGLLTRTETMQPARATAAAAVSLLHDGVVVLPRGNDGVGIVGAFANEAPLTLRLLVVDSTVTVAEIRARATGFPSAIVALLGQDSDSRATLPTIRAAFANRCWRAAGSGFDVLAFERASQ